MKWLTPFVPLLLFSALLLSCSNNLYFGTYTSVGLDASGTAKIPSRVSFAFSRGEVAVVPDDSDGNAHSVFASLDSEWTWFDGFIIKQLFATGEAADIASKEGNVRFSYSPTGSETSTKPLLFTTGTKLGIDIDFGQTSEAPASLLIGYRRSEMTLMPQVAGKKALDPVYADISIVSVDQETLPVSEEPRLGGVRIRQRFATGAAAVNSGANIEVKRGLKKAVYGSHVLKALEEANSRFQREGAIQSSFAALSPEVRGPYLAFLNELFGRQAPDLITAANLQQELGRLSDAQLLVAAEQIKLY